MRRTREQIAELGCGERLFVSTDVAQWIADKLDAIDDPPGHYLDYDAAFEWPSDDPRLVDLAARSRR